MVFNIAIFELGANVDARGKSGIFEAVVSR
jgi:hypothetical protein